MESDGVFFVAIYTSLLLWNKKNLEPVKCEAFVDDYFVLAFLSLNFRRMGAASLILQRQCRVHLNRLKADWLVLILHRSLRSPLGEA